jgi:PKD repeat protein
MRLKRCIVLLVFLAPVFLSGCVLNTIMNDVVNKAPSAVIDAAPREGTAPLAVRFDGCYSHDDDGTIAEYRWDFGDPTSMGTRVADACDHTFTQPGTYLVKLTVIDDEGLIDSQQIAVIVTNAAPVAVASVNNENPLPGIVVIFNASASYDAQDAIVSYEWDFDDGNSGSGVVVEHTYKQGGYYVATLTVTDADGATGRTHLGINVQPGESQCADDDDTCGADDVPYAIITSNWSCSGAQVGEPIRLDGTASRPAVGKILSYHWDFGDGSTGSGPVVTHAYDRQNTFIVTLTVIDEGGGVGTATGAVHVDSTCY